MRSVVIAVTIAAFASAAAAGEPPGQRQGELRHLLLHDCGSCHGLTMKGGLGAPLLAERLSEKSDESLIFVILNGVPGTPMPPWRGELDREDAAWLVKELKNGAGHAH